MEKSEEAGAPRCVFSFYYKKVRIDILFIEVTLEVLLKICLLLSVCSISDQSPLPISSW